jgi:hypothetical protein
MNGTTYDPQSHNAAAEFDRRLATA